jgi:3-dehydroquinate dehydratase, type II
MSKILFINGPNLNMLGIREKSVYGATTLKDIEKMVRDEAEKLNVEVEFIQSNHEGIIIDTIHGTLGNYDAVVINPGAFTHYSYAIRDAIACINIPFIEVHISNIHVREEFRHTSVTAPVCAGQIVGMGTYGYVLGLYGAIDKIKNK